jgi:Peptidase propeptide and YPEB domain
MGLSSHTDSGMPRWHRAGRMLPALLFVLLTQWVPPAAAVEMPPTFLREPASRLAELTKDRAIEMAEQRFSARVVRADVMEVEGRRVYVLRLLSENGRVWTVRVDAESGNIT